MSNLEVYFPNHERALRFPWSLYHKPLLDNLSLALKSAKAGEHVLVLGPGAFQELGDLHKKGVKISILDIDPRVLEIHKELNHDKISNFYLVDDKFDGYPPIQEFDLIYAKEVIEHIVDYERFLTKLYDCLKPGGRIWLSTPNYGFFLLPLLENTFLEIIARFSGFSRKDIHPSKFNSEKLNESLRKSSFKDIVVNVMPFRLSLTVVGRK